MNPKILFYLTICSLFIVGCANNIEKKTAQTPYESYGQFVSFLKLKDHEQALNMLAKSNQERFENRNTDESFELFFPFFSSVDTVVTKESNHYQKIKNKIACVTIIGVDSKDSPTSLSFKLIFESGNWRFSLVRISYHETENEYPKNVSCPSIS